MNNCEYISLALGEGLKRRRDHHLNHPFPLFSVAGVGDGFGGDAGDGSRDGGGGVGARAVYAVRERTNELAVLKAVGFTDTGVLGLVLGEAFLLTAIGGGIGLALSWVMVSAGDPTGGFLPIFFIPQKDLVIGVALIAVTALVAGILPALQAQRLRIADALRR